MARRQAEIPGFEKQIENPAIEDAARAYCEVRDERAELSKKEKIKQLELLAIMRAHKVEVYEYLDDDGEILVVRIKQGDEKAVVEKTGEAEPEIGSGINPDIDQRETNLITDALAAQQDAGVSEDDEGNVVPIESAKPKAKKGRKSK